MESLNKHYEAAPVRREVEGKELYEFVISSNAIDRHLERMDIKGIDYSTFLKNPLAFWNHNSFDKPIGRWVDIYIKGDKLYGLLEIHEETEEARTLKGLVKNGYINATSIGFYSKETSKEKIPDELKEMARARWVENIIVHRKSELLEVSLVTIPSNPEALRAKSLADYKQEKINNKQLEFIEHTIKAGQVLSAKNKERLIKASLFINEVLESSSNNDNDNDDQEDEEPEEMQREAVDYKKIEEYINHKLNRG